MTTPVPHPPREATRRVSDARLDECCFYADAGRSGDVTLASSASQLALDLRDSRAREADLTRRLAEAERDNEVLRQRADAATEALGWFVGADDRFHVAVGGNPNMVDRMIAEAQARYAAMPAAAAKDEVR